MTRYLGCEERWRWEWRGEGRERGEENEEKKREERGERRGEEKGEMRTKRRGDRRRVEINQSAGDKRIRGANLRRVEGCVVDGVAHEQLRERPI